MKTPPRFILAALLLAAACALPACVERKITIGSDPSGAEVMLNDVAVGRTPITVPFTWYGDYHVVLRYEKNVGTVDDPVMKHYYLDTHRRASAPPQQWIGVDLFTELLPIPFDDHQVWAFEIPAAPVLTDDELIQHAAELKSRLTEPEELKKKK